MLPRVDLIPGLEACVACAHNRRDSEQVPDGGSALDTLLKSVKVGLVDQGQKLAASDAILKKHRAERRGTESKPEQHPSLA